MLECTKNRSFLQDEPAVRDQMLEEDKVYIYRKDIKERRRRR